jgi:hypothetical protein
VTYPWYGEGTRFLDISDPRHPRQIAYWRPDDTLVWASYFRGATSTPRTTCAASRCCACGARQARHAKREVRAAPMSAKQRRFLVRMASVYRADPATRGLCLLIQ